MSSIKNVIVLGVGNRQRGPRHSLSPNLRQLHHNHNNPLNHLSPRTHLPQLPPSIRIIPIDYSSPTSLVTAFKNQHAIIEAFNPAAASHEKNIIDAAISAGVRHIITPDFSSDTFNQHVAELGIFEPKLQAQKYLEERVEGTGLKWTAIINGPLFDWAMTKPGLFWVDPGNKKVLVFGSGNQRVSMSGIDLVGRAAVEVLSEPDEFANRPAYFADYTVSTNELLAIVKEIMGSGFEEWTVENVPVEVLWAEGRKMWDVDTETGVEDRLNTKAYAMLGTYGVFEEGNRFGADFEKKLEKGFGRPVRELKGDLEGILHCA